MKKGKNFYLFLKFLGSIFVMLGLFLLFLPLYFHFIYKENISLTTTSLDTDILSQETSSKKEETKAILEIKTDNFEIIAPVVEGVEMESFKKGVGHHPNTAWPGPSGNVVLSGHRWYPGISPYYRIFYNLDKLKIGDKVIIYYNRGKFTYEVIERKIVLPSSTEILNQTKKPILTLYTCTPLFTAKKRLVFVAKLVSWEPQF